jgi:diguanylate cyclase (GGDEF)-like protein
MSNHRERVHILLVSETQDNKLFFESILSKEPDTRSEYRLDSVSNLKDALSHHRRHAADVLLLDIAAGGSGIDVLKKCLSEISDAPIVAFTEDGNTTHTTSIINSGAQDYLVKGQVNHFLFTRTILHAIERHKVRREYEKMVMELKSANEKLEKIAMVDSLTGLLNRRGLQEALSREIHRTHNDESELMAILMDLDDFKHVNDTLGHAVGDVLLREIAQKIQVSIRLTDYAARVGGDEFLVLIPQTRFAEGVRVADKIRRAVCGLQAPLSLEYTAKVTASIGLISVSEDTLSVDELLAKAHLVLQVSKKNGKNKVSFERTGEAFEAGQQSQLAKILQALKEGNQYKVVKQPIMNLVDGKMVGYEFLSRFSVEGLELPDDFFRVCLENNILTLVDRTCLKNCITAGQELADSYVQHINLFPSTIIDIPIANLIQIFGENGRNGKYCIEISEQQIIGDPSYLIGAVAQFKKMGIAIAIDDVGFGRSCLESLILLEPHIVKIDKKWVNGIAGTEWRQRSLKRLLKVARSLGSEVVAEGIETKEDMEMLVTLGVKYGQGYYLGRPA